MKTARLLCFSLFFLVTSLASAQVYKFKASSYSTMEKDDKGKWGKWSPFKESTVVITLDGKKDRIVIASQEIQLFQIVTYGKKISNEFDDIVPFECTDLNGGDCSIQIVTRKNQDNRKQIYVNYNDVKFVYNVYDTK